MYVLYSNIQIKSIKKNWFGTIVDYDFKFSKNSSKYEITIINFCDRELSVNMYRVEKSTYTVFNSKPPMWTSPLLYLCVDLFPLLKNGIFVCLFDWGFGPNREFFTHIETSPLPVNGFKFWPMFGSITRVQHGNSFLYSFA